MPIARAIRNNSGPNSMIAGMPSSTLPRTTNATIDTGMNIEGPPGGCSMNKAGVPEKPNCVSARAIAVALPIIVKIAPDNAAVSISMGISRRGGKPAAHDNGIYDADG